MMYIVMKHVPQIIWHVGEILPIFELDEVNFVQADGDELEHIRSMFPALTPTNKRIVCWVGDIAKTIAVKLLTTINVCCRSMVQMEP